jgi:hypothetical protein
VATEYPYLTQSDNPEKVRPIEIIILWYEGIGDFSRYTKT